MALGRVLLVQSWLRGSVGFALQLTPRFTVRQIGAKSSCSFNKDEKWPFFSTPLKVRRIFSVFCRKIGRKLHGNFVYFSSFFVIIFIELCAGMGKAGWSRSICGNPDRDCTENTRFCSAMSTKSEIVKVIPEKRLTPRFNRNPSV